MYIPKNWHSHFNILIFDHIDSTNEEAKRVASLCPDKDFLIWSHMQTKGKGRNSNSWISPKDNLYLSILTQGKEDISNISYLPFIMALAIGDVIKKYTNNADLVQYKWPNDVLYDGKKIAGILIETKITNNNQTDWVIIGTGINLISSPKIEGYPTTNIFDITKQEISVEDAIDQVMHNLAYYQNLFQKEGFKVIKDLWLTNAFGIGKLLTVSSANSRLLGTLEGIDDDGAILLKLSNGSITKILSGDLFIGDNNFPTMK
jgi:BirA family transcriptional regulator, biotin operon repressor / biotin---[acetyl-CoA-carboxylase] ligase